MKCYNCAVERMDLTERAKGRKHKQHAMEMGLNDSAQNECRYVGRNLSLSLNRVTLNLFCCPFGCLVGSLEKTSLEDAFICAICCAEHVTTPQGQIIFPRGPSHCAFFDGFHVHW